MKTRAVALPQTVRSVCSYCGVGCGILIHHDARGRLSVEGDPDYPVNKGMLCSKGRNLHYVVENRADRLLYPEMRRSPYEPLARVSWDEALERIASVFGTFIHKFGPDSVGFYVSGQLLTEEYYIVNKLTKGFIGTNNIDTNSRLCMSSAVAAYKLALGEDVVPVSYDDIELADCFLITGANPAWCHPILFRRLEAHQAANPHVKIIVADPRLTQTAQVADIHLQLKPGTDIYLNYALARCLFENGWIDSQFIEQHTTGFDAFKEMVMARTVDVYAQICDVPEALIRKAAQYIGQSKGMITMWAMGLNQSVVGVDKNLSLLNLSLITGQIGKPGAGPFSLTGQPNAMGGRETGGLANLLPAHRDLSNAADRKYTADFWGSVGISEKAGFSATEMFEALADDRLKAIYIICTNPLTSLPNVRFVEEALRKGRFVVVQDISGQSTALPFADVVLPAAGWAEKEGTMTNSDRRISLLQKAVNPPGEARPDVEILCELARRMGYKGFDYKNCAAIYDEYVQLTEQTRIDISGLSYQLLSQKGSVQWPFPKNATHGTTRMFADHQFFTPDRKAKFHAPQPENKSEQPSPDYPFVLTTGRVRDQWHTMTRTGKVQRLCQHAPEPFLEIHPEDALKLQIADGDLACVQSKFGEARLKARHTVQIKTGVVFAPMHWGRTLAGDLHRINNVTTTLVDARSKEPDFKFTAVRVTKYVKPSEKIVVVGAGAAAHKLITRMRELGSEDEIHVFSDEKDLFYNRVLLPEYITGEKQWDNLLKTNDRQLKSQHIHLHPECKIVALNRTQKTIADQRGAVHAYDKLVLATGSRATLPADRSSMVEGVFTVRSRYDAEQIMQSVAPGDTVVVVGAGLIGLEMAAALQEYGIQVALINRVSRLMNRQLDQVASEIVQEIIQERGIQIYSNDEVEFIQKTESQLRVQLKSGQSIECNAVVYGIGTTPNVELARQAGLHVQRGVVVNGCLQTSDESVFAIGEIAQHNEQLYGITMVAELQAEVVAQHLLGDVGARFDGSFSMNLLKCPGVELCAMGLAEIPTGGKGYEEILFVDRAARFYKKCIIHQDKLVGAILLGDKNEFAEFKQLIQDGLELSEKRLYLLRSGKPAPAALGVLVCSCNQVGRGNIEQHLNSGITDFSQLCLASGAGLGCGSCKPEVKLMLDQHLSNN